MNKNISMISSIVFLAREVCGLSSGIKALLYILSFFIPIVGIIVGIIWMNDKNEEKKQAGKICLIIGIVSIVLSCICWFAASLLPTLFSGY
jgi:hypothetical protein